jgi:hypothetical protein
LHINQIRPFLAIPSQYASFRVPGKLLTVRRGPSTAGLVLDGKKTVEIGDRRLYLNDWTPLL